MHTHDTFWRITMNETSMIKVQLNFFNETGKIS